MIEKPNILTVTELTKDIKEVLENVFAQVSVIGEITNLRKPSSGHIYFSLKDDVSIIKCVLFKTQAEKHKFSLEEGLKIICHGRVGVYERDGQYQLYAQMLEPQGIGELQLAFEQLKEKLGKEGLFDEAHKREIPFLPKAIGVVTSLTGAVIRDIFNVLDRRFSSVHIILNPVRVQGDEAVPEIVEAIKNFNELKCVDVIIVARGGGSAQDLFCFNDERVARAIYGSEIPIISAVGHETDFTIADFVADKRASTPSVAAEIVIPEKQELIEKIEALSRALKQSVFDIVPQYVKQVKELMQNLERAIRGNLEAQELRLDGLMNSLNVLNPLAILKRGYSITTFADSNRVVYKAKEASRGDKIKVKIFEGELLAEVI